MNPLLYAALCSIVRAVLYAGSGWLVNHHVWTESQATDYVVAAAAFIVTSGWSLWEKYGHTQILNTALMFANKSYFDVKAYVKDPDTVTPAITTPPNTVPGVPIS